ncbi:MAG: hypothetical protein ACXWSD_04160, partial [Bdellovibrionota bacterium]
MKGVAMSAGRQWIKELYVGFLLLALSFLYLSHLNTEYRKAALSDEMMRLRHNAAAEAIIDP